MLVGPIPSSFIIEKTSWSLPELRWAFDNGIIGAQIVVDVVTSMAARDGDDSNIVTRLAAVTHAELPEVSEILSAVPLENGEVDLIRRKWVWLVLSWLYEHHRDDDDVLEQIDGLYADFGYPPEMVAFGPYAPAYQVKGDPVAQREAVIGEWLRYLTRAGEEFEQRRSS
jgi:hypothetical protein